MKYRRLVPLLLIVTVAACHSASAPGLRLGELNQELQFAPKQPVAYGSPQALAVEFIRVVEDSRCPKDTTCVWAGEVKVQIATRLGSAAPVEQEVKAGEVATSGPFQVTVVNVQPEKLSTREIPPEEYRVTLKVEKSQQ